MRYVRPSIRVALLMVLAALAVGATYATQSTRMFSPTLEHFVDEQLFPFDAAPLSSALTTPSEKALAPLDAALKESQAAVPAAEKPSAVPASDRPASSDGGSADATERSERAASVAPTKLQQAQAILNQYIERYPILKGTTVEIGDAKGHQAVAYYTLGHIVISPNHSASLERILAHEIWHVIDWRDNGRIDWGENIPPSNASDYEGRG